MRVEDLFEARSNPNLNPRMTPNDVLSMYGGQKDVYIHFTDSDKIGINPNPDPRYPNPYGVYSYPIEEVKRVTNGFSKPVYDRMFAGYMKNIFVFRYNANKPLYLRETNIPDREFETVRNYFISKSNGQRLDEINDAFRGNINRAADLWAIVFKLIELLRLPSSSTSYTVFRKVLGYDMILDDGLGMMYGTKASGLRTQVVHMDTSKIKVVEVLDNKPTEPRDRIVGREENEEDQKKRDEKNKINNDNQLARMSLNDASRNVSGGNYPEYMDIFTSIGRALGSGGDSIELSNKFFERLIDFTGEVSRREEMPTDEEFEHITNLTLAIHYVTGLGGDFIDTINLMQSDFIFDIQRDLVDEYRQAARQALSKLRNMK